MVSLARHTYGSPNGLQAEIVRPSANIAPRKRVPEAADGKVRYVAVENLAVGKLTFLANI